MKYYPNNLIFIKILCFIPKDFVGSVSLVLFYGIVTTWKRKILMRASQFKRQKAIKYCLFRGR